MLSEALEIKKELLMIVSADSPEELPIKILKTYLNNIEAVRWSSNAFGDSETANDMVSKMNDKADKEAEALRKAIKVLELNNQAQG
jgi:hypothetical protein